VRLTVIGCAGSFPGPQSPASSYLVTVSDPGAGRLWRILLDIGNGSLGVLQRHTDPLALDAIVLTHLHPDHCLDLCGLYVMHAYRPGSVRPAPIPVFGPRGTKERIERGYDTDAGHLDTAFAFGELHHAEPVRIGPFSVTPYLMNHPVPTFGLRVEVQGRVLAYTGDTDTCDNLTPLLRGADLALMECAFVDGRDEPRDIHLTGSRAAAAALEAGGVGRLMLTHLPSWNDPAVCRAQAETLWPRAVELAQPETTYDV
jgi:ribonuclease BN (tRNA processing enzyme)